MEDGAMPNLLCVSHEWNLGFAELRELADAGFRVIPAATGFDAVKQFATAEIDAVVLNRRLPDIQVSDLSAYFRHHNPGVPIVLVSARMPVPDAPPSVDAVIGKSCCSGLLVATLQVLLRDPSAEPQGDDAFAQAA